jgi:hypothetical protein
MYEDDGKPSVSKMCLKRCQRRQRPSCLRFTDLLGKLEHFVAVNIPTKYKASKTTKQHCLSIHSIEW